ALAAGAVLGPVVMGGSGTATSYAGEAIDIELRGDSYVATVKDPFADHAEYTKGFKAVGLNVNLEIVPASPSRVGKIAGMSLSGRLAPNGRSIESGTAPAGCALGHDGCAMTVTVAQGWAGWASVKLGRAAKPGEGYRNWISAMDKGEMLQGYRADERTVGEVLTEVRRRGLTAVFQVITPNPDLNGYGVAPGGQTERVGNDWTVWEALSDRAGVVRLLVTREHLPKNPVYDGPRPVTSRE
ncbi:hypothetical protein ACFQ08_06045, partial [Streptosporangium algeriense]